MDGGSIRSQEWGVGSNPIRGGPNNDMSWATRHIEQLQNGETVKFRPRGNSMVGRVNSGQLCTVEPTTNLAIDDVVLCKVGGSQYLHLIKAIQGDRYQIGNNHGRINGWTSKHNIFGKLVKVED